MTEICNCSNCGKNTTCRVYPVCEECEQCMNFECFDC